MRVNMTELDKIAVPFPNFTPKSDNSAAYTISQAGRVRRSGEVNGSVIVRPQQRKRSGPVQPALVVTLGGGTACRSLPNAVFMAFGSAALRRRAKEEGLIPWHDMSGPVDPLTECPRCSVFDIYLVTRGDAQRFALHGLVPEDKTPIVEYG